MGQISTYPPITAFLEATPGDPATTTNTTGVMMGLGSVLTIVPSATGKISIKITGDQDNNTGGDGCQVRIRYGTGTAPINGAALTGTIIGSAPIYLQSNATGLLGLTFTPGRGNLSLTAGVSGLLIGTTYWFDISLTAVTGGTARTRNLSATITESTS